LQCHGVVIIHILKCLRCKFQLTHSVGLTPPGSKNNLPRRMRCPRNALADHVGVASVIGNIVFLWLQNRPPPRWSIQNTSLRSAANKQHTMHSGGSVATHGIADLTPPTQEKQRSETRARLKTYDPRQRARRRFIDPRTCLGRLLAFGI
jgi:hypothetical protein